MVELPEELQRVLDECSNKTCVLTKLHIGFYKIRKGVRGRPSFGRNWYGWALVYWYVKNRGRQWARIAREIYGYLRDVGIPSDIEPYVRIVSADTIEARFYEAMRYKDILDKFWEEVENISKRRKRVKEEVLWINLENMDDILSAFDAGDRRKLNELLKKSTSWETLAFFLAGQNDRDRLKTYLRWLAKIASYLSCREKGGSIEDCVLCGSVEKKPYYAPDISKRELSEIRMMIEEALDAYINICNYHPNTVRQVIAALNAISSRIKEALRNIHLKYKKKGTRKNDMHIAFEDELEYFIEHYRERGFNDFEALVILTHITLGSREGTIRKKFGGVEVQGGLLKIEWNNIHWDEIDGEMLPIAADVPEPKTGHGDITWWLGCRLDLFWGKLVPRMLKRYWISLGKPREGRLFPISYNKLLSIHHKFRDYLNWYRNKYHPERPVSDWKPHDARRTHAYLLINADVPFEIIAGGMRGNRIESPLGVLWMTDITLVEYYQGLERKAKKYVDIVIKKMKEMFSGVYEE